MSACAEDAEKLEIAVTGGGEDSMQLKRSVDINGLSALRHLYEAGLYKLDAEGNVELGQAASVEESDDKLTWTFTLRDDITWSDGQAVTAADFVFDFDNLQPRAEIIPQCFQMWQESWEAPDDKTVVIKLKQPCSYLPSILAFPSTYPARWIIESMEMRHIQTRQFTTDRMRWKAGHMNPKL